MKWSIVISLLTILIGFKAYSQDTTLILRGPTIMDTLSQAAYNFHSSLNTETRWQSLDDAGPLQQGLIFSSSGITRSNGPGKVTTFTKHGMPTEHLRVFWNDIELNSPLNGVVDFSTFPVFLLSNETDLYDPAVMQPKITNSGPSSSLTVMANYGTFRTIDLGLKSEINNNKTKIRVGGLYSSSQNNFEYSNDLNQTISQTNSAYSQYHGSLDIIRIFNQQSKLSLSGLISSAFTEIPPSIFNRTSHAEQESNPLRFQLTYSKESDAQSLKIHVGSHLDELHYLNPDLDLDVYHKFGRHQVGAEFSAWLTGRSKLEISTKQAIESGESDNFEGSENNILSETRIKYSYALRSDLILEPEGGYEYARNIWVPVQYGLSIKYLPFQNTRLVASIKSINRIPTFNERYWQPGGQLNLKPETGQALNLHVFHRLSDVEFELGANSHRLQNRIIWIPGSGGIFSPTNVGRIGSEEIYFGISARKKCQNFDISIDGRYTYLNGRILEYFNNNLEGNQIPFSPRHSINHNIQVNYDESWNFIYSGKYQSDSYTNLSNDTELDAFYIAFIELQKYINNNDWNSRIFVRINNLFNQDYYLTNGFPQPPRHWQLGLLWKLN